MRVQKEVVAKPATEKLNKLKQDHLDRKAGFQDKEKERLQKRIDQCQRELNAAVRDYHELQEAGFPVNTNAWNYPKLDVDAERLSILLRILDGIDTPTVNLSVKQTELLGL